MSSEVEILPGLEIIPYEHAADRGLIPNEPAYPEDPPPDYASMDALVLAREMTWGPCIVPPKTTRDIGSSAPKPRFQSLPGCSSGVVFNLLAVITSHRVQLLSVLCCAPEFVDVHPSFGPGSRQTLRWDDNWTGKELTPEHIGELEEQLQAWSGFDRRRRDTLELAVSRLASSIQRDRGRFWAEDRILDAAIALEVMYGRPPALRAPKAGHFLGEEAGGRIKILGQMRAFAQARNSIVHGDRGRMTSDRKALRDAADSGFALAYATVKKLLARGEYPNWDELIMS